MYYIKLWLYLIDSFCIALFLSKDPSACSLFIPTAFPPVRVIFAAVCQLLA